MGHWFGPLCCVPNGTALIGVQSDAGAWGPYYGECDEVGGNGSKVIDPRAQGTPDRLHRRGAAGKI